MRITGYCTECHRIRPVQVSGAGMARLAAKGTAMGICSSCQEKQDARRLVPAIVAAIRQAGLTRRDAARLPHPERERIVGRRMYRPDVTAWNLALEEIQ